MMKMRKEICGQVLRSQAGALPPESGHSAEQEEIRRMMAAEEASLRGGVFERILKFYERWVRRALEHPAWLALFCAILIGVSYVSYKHLGSDLLPAMDEGGFVLDYVMPPGSSLQETNRVISHVESIVREPPKWKARRAAPVCSWGLPRSPSRTPAIFP